MAPAAHEEREPSALVGATLRGAMWVAASRIGGKALFFLSTLVLARLLVPEDFGVAGYAVTLIVLLGSLPELGTRSGADPSPRRSRDARHRILARPARRLPGIRVGLDPRAALGVDLR